MCGPVVVSRGTKRSARVQRSTLSKGVSTHTRVVPDPVDNKPTRVWRDETVKEELMLGFGRRKTVDPDEMLDQLRERQEALREQLASLEPGSAGGTGKFLLGLLVGAGVGAALLYFLDSEQGESRRQSLAGIATGFGGGADEAAERDQEVTGRVEAELFRDPSIPRGQFSINTVDNVVYIRGTATSQEQIDEIERRVKVLPGVDAVINLLRLPTTS